MTGKLVPTPLRASRSMQIFGAIRSVEILARTYAAFGHHSIINFLPREHYPHLILVIELWKWIFRLSQMWRRQTALRQCQILD